MASRNPNDLRQLYDIHVSFLPERAKIALKKLDTPTALCHGFRFLADRLGYSFDQITVIERTASQRASSPTLTLIEELTLRRDISVGHVYFALVDLRHAASNIIEENLPEIFANFHRRRRPMPPVNGTQNLCTCEECMMVRQSCSSFPSQSRLRSSFESTRSIAQATGRNPLSGSQSASISIRNIRQENVPPLRNRSSSEEGSFSLPNDIGNDRSGPTSMSTSKSPSRQYTSLPEKSGTTGKHNALDYNVNNFNSFSDIGISHSSEPWSLDVDIHYQQRPSPLGASNDSSNSQTNVKTVYQADNVQSPVASEYKAASDPTSDRQVKRNAENERNSWHGNDAATNDALGKANSAEELRLKENKIKVSDINKSGGSSVDSPVWIYNNDLDISDSEEQLHHVVDRHNIRCEHSNSSNGAASERRKLPSEDNAIPYQLLMKSKINVFFTFSFNPYQDSEDQIREMKNLTDLFPRNRVTVTLDRQPNSFQAIRQNKLDWLDKSLAKADYVVICITPTYHADIQAPSEREAQPRPLQLNARYIYNKLRDEYFSNCSINKRMIPVMFPNTGAKYEHVPECMKSTLVFSYPQHQDNIVGAVLDQPMDLLDIR